jgi:thiamine biosynthesis lipoprotein
VKIRPIVMVFFFVLSVPGVAEANLKRSWPVMGTFAEVILDTEASERTEEAVESVRSVFDRINRTMSVYKNNSDLTRVNRWAGFRSVGVDPWVAELVAHGKEAQWVTRGAFRLSTLGEGIKRGLKPDRVNVVLGSYGPGSIQVRRTPSRLYLNWPGMGLDLGGIAKGYALDRAAAELRSLGFDRFLLNLGRSLAAGDPPRGQDGWTVKINGVYKPRTVRDVVLSTSRQGVRSDTDHIVTEGNSTTSPARTVTVMASRGWVSDMASTALLVNPDLEKKLRETYESIERIWIGLRTD